MKLVVDANILFAALIKDGLTRDLLLRREHELYAPEIILTETSKYLSYLMKKSNLDERNLRLFLNTLLYSAKVRIIKTMVFEEHIAEALRITPDIDDTQYMALALKLDCQIWSNDKKLKEQDKVKVYSTDEICTL